MPLTVLFSSKRSKIDALELDATITSEHVSENEITQHPVEIGADITDHVRPKPDRLTIEGIISDTPSDFDTRVNNDGGRADTAYQILLALKSSAKLISVITRRRKYENMVIESIRVPDDNRIGRALRFTAQLREIVTVESQTVTITAARGKDKLRLGKKSTPDATPQQERKMSFLAQGKQWASRKWSGKQ